MAVVYTRDKAVIRKSDSLAEEFPDIYKQTGQTEVDKTYSMPKSYVKIGADALGNIQRLNNALETIPPRMAEAEQQLANVQKQLETAKEKVKKPFEKEVELKEKQERLSELNALLNMDERGDNNIGMEMEESGVELLEYGLDAKIVDMAVTGSRSRESDRNMQI